MISASNPFKKDDLAADYDKDSEEEFAELEAEDLQSDKEDEEEDEEEESEEQWLIKDEEETEKKAEVSFYEIMEIRKSYNKPILIDFANRSKQEEKLIERLQAKTISFDNEEYTFPLSVSAVAKSDKPEMDDLFRTFVKHICSAVHGSKENKEDLISTLNGKYDMLTKAQLNKFFKKFANKEKCEITGKKRWFVSKIVCDLSEIKESDLEEYKEINLKKEKEKERLEKELKEREERQQKENEEAVQKMKSEQERKEAVSKSEKVESEKKQKVIKLENNILTLVPKEA